MEYEYEKVNLEDWQIVKMMSEGKKLYVKVIDSHALITPDYSIYLINHDINNIYTRKESPWWEGCEGMPVMVSDNELNWSLNVFDRFDGYEFCCGESKYKYARPLTAAERDAIKVRD